VYTLLQGVCREGWENIDVEIPYFFVFLSFVFSFFVVFLSFYLDASECPVLVFLLLFIYFLFIFYFLFYFYFMPALPSCECFEFYFFVNIICSNFS